MDTWSWLDVMEAAIGQLIAIGFVAAAFILVGIWYFLKDLYGTCRGEMKKRKKVRLQEQLARCRE